MSSCGVCLHLYLSISFSLYLSMYLPFSLRPFSLPPRICVQLSSSWLLARISPSRSLVACPSLPCCTYVRSSMPAHAPSSSFPPTSSAVVEQLSEPVLPRAFSPARGLTAVLSRVCASLQSQEKHLRQDGNNARTGGADTRTRKTERRDGEREGTHSSPALPQKPRER